MTAAGKVIENTQNVRNRTFRVVISKTEDGYMADIPSLKHCMSFGDTPEEAMENLHEALEGTLLTMQDLGWPIPDDSQNFETTITHSLVIA